VPDAVVKQLQLNRRGPGVGSAVGTGTGVRSGVATTPGTLTNCDGAPGKFGTEGRVSGGGPGGGAGACACATPASAASAIAIPITERALGRAPEQALKQTLKMDVERILIAKKFSSRNPRPLMPLPRASAPAAATERAAMIRKPDPRCKRGAFGQKCPVRSSLDVRDLRNAPAAVSSLGEVLSGLV
jgi:hypothetical protein